MVKASDYVVYLLQYLVAICKTAKAITVWLNTSPCALLCGLDLQSVAEYVDPVES